MTNDTLSGEATQPSPTTLQGRTVTLVPLSPTHTDALYPLINSDHPAQISLWDYMLSGPYNELPAFRASMTAMSTSTDPLFFSVLDNRTDAPDKPVPTAGNAIGHVSLMNIATQHRRVEIGAVLFSLAMQKTTGATESIYLLLRHCFDVLGYRRVEWKCNDLNEASRRAALRLGFSFEGVFRQHMIVKGRNRDTAWFSMLGDEWNGGVKTSYEEWLAEGNFDDDGKQIVGLQEIRRRIMHL